MITAHAKVKMFGNRWHWSITIRSSVGHGHVYQGHEPTWKLAFAMLEYTWNCHKMEWQLPSQVKRGVTSAMNRVDNLKLAG